jgi:hypothetical protein
MITPDLSRAKWRKSSHSGHDGGNCIEVASLDGFIAIRDSKNPVQPTLPLMPSTWSTFIRRIKNGE